MKTSIESIINAINNIHKKTIEKGICNILQLQKFLILPRVKDCFFQQVKFIIIKSVINY